MSTYSAFFSSGLLAPSHVYPKATSPPSPGLIPMIPGLIPPSPGPAFGSSPIPIADDSDVEDLDIRMEDGVGRDRTPTPASIGGRSRSGSINAQQQQQQGLVPRPRLRKRRSSLTVGTSPLNAIKSPQRNAGNALHLQQRLPAPGSIGRSRGASLSLLGLGAPPTVESRIQNPNGNIASEGTSLMGRMRSGSTSTLGNLFKPRRNVRRLASVPAPAAPPPTTPLPAIPSHTLAHRKSFSLFHNTSIFPNPRNIFNQVANRQPLAQRAGTDQETQAPCFKKAKGRDRAFSCTAGVNIDTRIDEEMRES